MDDEDEAEVLEELMDALGQLVGLRGDPAILAKRGYTETTAAAVAELKAKYPQEGFSEGDGCTREDYERILALAQADRARATAAPTATPAPRVVHEQGDYRIVDAAQTKDGLYLLDADGALVRFDPHSGEVELLDNTVAYTALCGNGSGAMAMDQYCGIRVLGELTLDLNDLGSVEQPMAHITLAEDSVLMVLGPDGLFSADDDTLVGEGYGIYWKAKNGGNDQRMTAPSLIQINNRLMDRIFLVAAGDENVALARRNERGAVEIYVRSTQRNNKFNSVTEASIGGNAFTLIRRDDQLDPVALAVSSRALAIVERDGTVQIAGPNDAGQLGVGDQKQRNRKFVEMLTRQDTPLTDVHQVILTDGLTLCLTNAGRIYVAGAHEDGFAHPLEGVSAVSRMIRLDDESVMLLNADGQWMMLSLPDLRYTRFATVSD